MKALLAVALALLAGAAPAADAGGQLRWRWDGVAAASQGPLAQAEALSPGPGAAPRDALSLNAELHGRWRFVTANAALDAVRAEGGAFTQHARVNELYGSGEALGWQLDAGRKIVGWDVGYGFRPNDMVQAEPRLQLLPGTPQGRVVLDAERFGSDSAWSLVLANPQRPGDGRGDDEPALALRAYRRFGATDAYAFARWGEHTHASLGAAAAWVATETLELHASLRWAEHVDALRFDPAGAAGRGDPWRMTRLGPVSQALVGASWTGANRFSVLTEAWYDGSAMSDAQWRDWSARNAALVAAANAPVGGPAEGAPSRIAATHSPSPAAAASLPPPAAAAALAGQAQAFEGQNLRRRNLLLRVAWTGEVWRPSLDLLVQPEDGGRVWTAALTWQGDRCSVDAGLRQYGGPQGAVLAQLPLRRTGYLAATWTF